MQKKNNWAESPEYPSTPAGLPRVIRERPGKGYRHLLLKRDIERFVALLPDWETLAIGLEAVLLAEGEDGTHGFHYPGVVAICAWPDHLWDDVDAEYFNKHLDVFRQIGVLETQVTDGHRLHFTESTAKAFQLIHIFTHELGHHHDRMTTRSKHRASRGESFAEHYALTYGDSIWDRYITEFGMP